MRVASVSVHPSGVMGVAIAEGMCKEGREEGRKEGEEAGRDKP